MPNSPSPLIHVLHDPALIAEGDDRMSKKKIPSPIQNVADLRPDPCNANLGTERGVAALARSLEAYGAGRAVLIDRHGVVIAGNKTVEQARRLNLPLHVVKTDGQHLIAVQREDLDLRRDPRARALAVADNRVGELDLEWNVEMLKHLREDGLDLSAFWTDVEFANLFDEAAVYRTRFPGHTFVLCRLA